MNEEAFRQRLYKMPLKKLQKKTDDEFQLMRRLEEADECGTVECISCGALGHYKEFDGGHFIQRHHLGVRHEASNVWPQCKKCNYHLGGNHAKYRDALIKKLGPGGVELLEMTKDNAPAYWREWLINTFFYAKKRIAERRMIIGE